MKFLGIELMSRDGVLEVIKQQVKDGVRAPDDHSVPPEYEYAFFNHTLKGQALPGDIRQTLAPNRANAVRDRRMAARIRRSRRKYGACIHPQEVSQGG